MNEDLVAHGQAIADCHSRETLRVRGMDDDALRGVRHPMDVDVQSSVEHAVDDGECQDSTDDQDPEDRKSANDSGEEEDVQIMTGLENLGDKCYQNAMLQILSEFSEIREKIEDVLSRNEQNEHSDDSKWIGRDQVLRETLKLLIELQSNSAPTFQPYDFIRSLPVYWRQNRQRDSVEFYQWIVNLIVEHCASGNPAVNVLNNWMSFDVSSILKCTECNGDGRVRTQPITCLPIAISGTTLQDDVKTLMSKCWQSETLSGGEGVLCDNCLRKTTTEKTLTMVTAPQILHLQLKRFEFNGGSRRKIYEVESRNVLLILNVNLGATEWLCVAQKITIPLIMILEEELVDGVGYALCAFSLHQGDHERGHYFSITRNEVDTQTAFDRNEPYYGKWKYCNDADKHEISAQQVRSYVRVGGRCTPYSLFYKKCAVVQNVVPNVVMPAVSAIVDEGGVQSAEFTATQEVDGLTLPAV